MEHKMTHGHPFLIHADSLSCPGLLVWSASMSGLLLSMISVLTAVLGAWRLGADLGWAGAFFVADGLLSRCLLWFAVAISAQGCSCVLNLWVSRRAVDPSAL